MNHVPCLRPLSAFGEADKMNEEKKNGTTTLHEDMRHLWKAERTQYISKKKILCLHTLSCTHTNHTPSMGYRHAMQRMLGFLVESCFVFFFFFLYAMERRTTITQCLNMHKPMRKEKVQHYSLTMLHCGSHCYNSVHTKRKN